MIDAIRDALLRRWETVRPDMPRPATAIVAGVDRAHAAKVTFLYFDRNARLAAVVKVPRKPESEQFLEREFETVHSLWEQGASAVRRLSPQPLLLERVGGRLVFAQAPLPGQPMSIRYYQPGHVRSPELVDADFNAAGGWLREFHEQTTRSHTSAAGGEVSAYVHDVVTRYQAEVGADPVVAELLGQAMERAGALDARALPIGGVHGDYWMSNILMTGQQLSGVFDWEYGTPAGLPFRDIYKFPNSYGFYLDRAEPELGSARAGHPDRRRWVERWRRFGDWPNIASFGYAWFGTGWFPDRVRRHVTDYLAAARLPAACNAVFFPLFLAEQALVPGRPRYREGYRALLRAVAEEGPNSWLWEGSEPSPQSK